MRYFILTILTLTSFVTFAQARLVLNNNGYVRITNGAYVVLDNGNANAITLTGTGGHLVTEAETNRLRWNISNNTGTYTVPFSTTGGTKLPLTMQITTAGSVGGRIDFSTYPGASWDNNTYRPTGVTHMNDALTGTLNNSAFVVDRFWVMENSSYTTKPNVTMSFTYLCSEAAAPNTITVANLRAQRFNTSISEWEGSLSSSGGLWGTSDGVCPTGIVSGVTITGADFWRPWTLTDYTSPLPIKLLSFAANCRDGKALIQWSTASEINNDFFTIEKTFDGINFEFVAKIKGAGNSNSIINYSYTDTKPGNGKVYYRLTQTDFDGTTEVFDLISFECGTKSPLDIITVYNNQGGNVISSFSVPQNGKYLLSIIDARGRLIYHDNLNLVEGFNQVSLNMQEPSTGIYFIRLSNESEQISKKFFIR
ncbi:MAG: T9SS type A sorting domain-containing protein [Bacteroidia bacterium]